MESTIVSSRSAIRSTGVHKNWSWKVNKEYSSSGNEHHLFQYFTTFLIYFASLSLCLFSLSTANLKRETRPPVDALFPTSKCQSLQPQCECEDFYETISITCQNLTDFETFTKILEKDSSFEKGVAYEIILFGTKILPRQFLKGLMVNRLYIDDFRTESLEDGALDDILKLRKFHVKTSSLTEIPDLRPVGSSLRNLNLDNSLLTSVQGDHLKNLMFLETLSFVNNTIKYVASDAFQGTENILVFDMSYNHLHSLPSNLFDTWKKLRKVVLSHNHLLHINQLFAVAHPRFLYLDHNNLTDLDAVLHPNMSQVETVQLSFNPFSQVTTHSFNGKLSNTRFLYLDHCHIREFDASHYAALRSLATLDLSYNLIGKVAENPITFGKDVELDFTGNSITEFNAKLSYNVKRIYLNKNMISSLGRTLQFSQTSQLSMADNRLESLHSEEFLGLHGAITLDLQGNFISSIERETFQGTRRSLMYLDLSRNEIRKLNGCVRSLSALILLNLTDNQIEGFETDEFQGLNQLQGLYLNNNRLKSLGYALQKLGHLEKLIISHNRIHVIKADQLPIKLQYLHVDGNPLDCDCQILSLLHHLNSTSLKTDVPICIPSNDAPPMGASLCPDGCRCFCTNNKDSHYISVDCSFAGLGQLPPTFTSLNPTETNNSFLVVYLSQNWKGRPFVIQDNIGSLDFSHNNLKSMDNVLLPKGIRYLNIGHNLLRRPPTSLLHFTEELERVTLSGNPWICDCETSAFKKWFLVHSFIVDINETRCGPESESVPGVANRTIWTLKDMDICPADDRIYIWIVLIVLSFLLVSCFIIIVWTRYRTGLNQ